MASFIRRNAMCRDCKGNIHECRTKTEKSGMIGILPQVACGHISFDHYLRVFAFRYPVQQIKCSFCDCPESVRLEWSQYYCKLMEYDCECEKHTPENHQCIFMQSADCARLCRDCLNHVRVDFFEHLMRRFFSADTLKQFCPQYLAKTVAPKYDLPILPEMPRYLVNMNDPQPVVITTIKEDVEFQSAIAIKTSESVDTEVISNDADLMVNTTTLAPAVIEHPISVPQTEFEAMVNREFLVVTNQTWDTTKTRHTNLIEGAFPTYFTSHVNLLPTNIFKSFSLMHGSFDLTIRLNNSPFHAGCLVLIGFPGGVKIDTVEAGDKETWITMPHAFLSAGDEHSVTLTVPYGSPYPFWRADALFPMSRFCLMVWNELKVGTGQPSSLKFSVWIKPNLKFYARSTIPTGLTVLDEQVEVQAASFAADAVVHSGILNKSINAVTKSFMGKFGDKDCVGENDMNHMSTVVVDAPRVVSKLSYRDGDLVGNHEERFGVPSVINLADRCKIPSRVDVIQWKTTDNVGDAKYAKPIGPCLLGGHTQDETWKTFSATNIGYWSSFAYYWRGSIEITVEVIATRFHQGTLWCCWNPRGDSGITDTQSYNLQGGTLAIGQAGNRMTFRIPYAMPQEYGSTNPSYNDETEVNGRFYVLIQNPLVAPTSVASSVDINIYAAAGDDYKLYYGGCAPNVHREVHGSWVPAITEDVEFQSLSDTRVDLFKSAGPFPLEEGEGIYKPIGSAAELMRRPTPWRSLTPNKDSFRRVAKCTPNFFGKCIYSGIEAGWAYCSGSIRVHIVTLSSTNTRLWVAAGFYPTKKNGTREGTNDYSEVQATYDKVFGANFVFKRIGLDGCATFEIPRQAQVSLHGMNAWWTEFQIWAYNPDEVQWNFFLSAADDYQMYYPIGVGRWRVRVDDTKVEDELAKISIIDETVEVQHEAVRFSNFLDDSNLLGMLPNVVGIDGVEDAVPEPLPPGLAYDDDGDIIILPDEDVEEQYSSDGESEYSSTESEYSSTESEYDHEESNDEETDTEDELWELVNSFNMDNHPVVAAFDQYENDDNSSEPEVVDEDVEFQSAESKVSCPREPCILTRVVKRRGGRKVQMMELDSLFESATPDEPSWVDEDVELQNESSIMSRFVQLISSVLDSIRSIPSKIGEVFSAVKDLTNLQKKGKEVLLQMQKSIVVLVDSILPLITAIHSIAYGDNAMKVLGVASTVRILTKLASRAKRRADRTEKGYQTLQDFVEKYPEVNDAELLSMRWRGVPTNKDDSIETIAESVDEQGLFDAFGLSGDLSTPALLFRLTSIIPNTIYGFFLGAGLNLGYGYKTYLRRVCSGAGLAYLLSVIWHSLLYLIHGNNLNLDWEKDKQTEFLKVARQFEQFKADGLFELDKIHNKLPKNDIAPTGEEFLVKIKELCITFRDTMSECKYPAYYDRLISNILTEYRLFHNKTQYRTTQSEPVGIFIGGDAGVGKSLLLSNILPRLVLKRVGLHHDPDEAVYTVPIGEEKYWELYDGQPYVFLDELLQVRDGEDPMIVLRAINSVRMPINKAHLEDKGTVFRSKFFACTSNSLSVTGAYHTLNSPEAIIRRFPFAYKMTVKTKYADGNGRLNLTLLAKDMKEAKDNDALLSVLDEAWNLCPLDLKTGFTQQSITVPLSKLVDSIVEEHRKNNELFSTLGEVMSVSFQMDNGSEVDDMPPLVDMPFNPEIEVIATEDDDEFHESSDYFSTRVANFGVSSRSREEADQFIEFVKISTSAELGIDVRVLKHFMDIKDKNGQRVCQTPFQFAKGVENPIVDDYSDNIYATCDSAWRKCSLMNTTKLRKFTGLLSTALKYFGIGSAIAVVIQVIASLCGGGAVILQAYADSIRTPTAKAGAIKTVEKAIPQNGSSDVSERISKNVRKLTTVSGMMQFHVHCLCLDSQTLLIPNHWYEKHREGCVDGGSAFICLGTLRGGEGEHLPVYIGPENSRLVYTKYAGKTHSTDVRLVRLRTEYVTRARDIKHFIRSENDYQLNGKSTHGSLISPFATKEPVDCVINGYVYAPSAGPHLYLSGKPTEKTMKGDCGKPYVVDGQVRPIVGIHSFLAPSGICGVGSFTKEDLDLVMTDLKPTSPVLEDEQIELQFDDIDPTDPCFKYWKPETNLLGKGRFGDWKLEHYTPPKTSFVPVTWAGKTFWNPEWECDFRPVALHPRLVEGVWTHPLISNSQKYSISSTISVPPSLHGAIVNYYTHKFEPLRRTSVLSEYEMINGTEIMLPIRMDTSCGYWSDLGFKEGKKQLFEPLQQEIGVGGQSCAQHYKFSERAKTLIVRGFNSTFRARLEQADELARAGTVPISIWISTCKDELRASEKVARCKTRVFEQPDLVYVLLFRKYFGSFLDYFKEKAGFFFYHGIGADKEVVWNEYLSGLRSMSAHGHAFDYSNWDGTVSQGAFQFFLDITDAYYSLDRTNESSKNRNARHALVRGMMGAYHIVGNVVVQSHKGNKSGNPFTDVFNSVSNTYLMYLCFLSLQTCAGGPLDPGSFDRHVRMLTYGDDVIMTVTPKALQWFTGPRVADLARQLGYKITLASKGEVVEDFQSISELTFLKSHFVWNQKDMVCWAPMPKPDILKELRFRPKGTDNDDEDLRLRCRVTLRFMAHHGKDEFEKFKAQLAYLGVPRNWIEFSFESIRDEIAAKQAGAVLYWGSL